MAEDTTDPLTDQRDDAGNLIDPPTIPSYEAKLLEAHALNDTELIEDITTEYHKAREELALSNHDRAERRKQRLKDLGVNA